MKFQTPSRERRSPRARLALGLAVTSAVLAACGGGGNDGAGIQLSTTSNRADLVSDGNAMVEVQTDSALVKQGLQIQLNGTDVTKSFVDQGGGRLVGLVTGLQVGANTLEASVKETGASRTRLVITNAPRSGPVFSGPAHLTPFYCATPTAQPAAGNRPATLASGLSGQPDENCNIPSETKLYYRTNVVAGNGAGQCSTSLPDGGTPPANPCWKPYTPGTTPADMAAPVTTDNGRTVPLIVRLERGTMNRGIYDLAVLFDPAQSWTAVTPQPQWNGKVYYSFGSSTGQPRRQARTTATAWSAQEEQLKRGWMVVSNSMTDSVKNSNRVLMAETVLMMKEHIGDTYGRIRYTVGTGCSGGSINSNMNLSIFPGLLDGVITSCTYPDSETTTLEVGDCVLLAEAYQKTTMLNTWAGLGLSQTQINARKAAINGHPDQTACHGWYNLFGSNGRPGVYVQRSVTNDTTGLIENRTRNPATGLFDPSVPGNNCELPNSAVYDPARPAETANLPRCNAWGWAENIWGRIPGTSTPRDTRDNVGVQYGLRALLNGSITAEEFVVLNELVGGTNKDSEFQGQRSVADTEALETAYRSGIVASGANLAKAPIIDLRGWDDSLLAANTPPVYFSATGIHHIWFTWAIRDRITRDAGDAQNQAIWRWANGNFSVPPGTLGLEAFTGMDQWLTTLVSDGSARSMEERVRAARPASTRDFCVLSTEANPANRTYDNATCDADRFLKPSLSPRQVAGGPRTEDVLKCQLKPLNAADYGAVTFTGGQWSRLQAVFSTGVCDWSKPGVGQQAAVGPLTFRAGPGGEPLPAAPRSSRR